MPSTTVPNQQSSHKKLSMRMFADGTLNMKAAVLIRPHAVEVSDVISVTIQIFQAHKVILST